jgi:hypothetical protein
LRFRLTEIPENRDERSDMCGIVISDSQETYHAQNAVIGNVDRRFGDASHRL